MEGMLIIEVYEYVDNDSSVPAFEYIPCELSKCLRGKNTTLKEIIQRGFDALPRKAQDSERRQEVLKKLDDAGIGKIDVVFHPEKGGKEPCIQLTNVEPVSLTYADARRVKQSKDSIILKGRYRLSTGNEVTILKDAQRLTLIYSSKPEGADLGEFEEEENQREICLNITYMQE